MGVFLKRLLYMEDGMANTLCGHSVSKMKLTTTDLKVAVSLTIL